MFTANVAHGQLPAARRKGFREADSHQCPQCASTSDRKRARDDAIPRIRRAFMSSHAAVAICSWLLCVSTVAARMYLKAHRAHRGPHHLATSSPFSLQLRKGQGELSRLNIFFCQLGHGVLAASHPCEHPRKPWLQCKGSNTYDRRLAGHPRRKARRARPVCRERVSRHSSRARLCTLKLAR